MNGHSHADINQTLTPHPYEGQTLSMDIIPPLSICRVQMASSPMDGIQFSRSVEIPPSSSTSTQENMLEPKEVRDIIKRII